MFKVVKWMNQSRLIAWLYLLIGLGALYTCYVITNDTLLFLENNFKASGTVDELKLDDGSYYAVVSFRDATGSEQNFVSNVGCSPACYSIAEKVEVLYQHTSDSEPRINDFNSIWFASYLIFGIGLVFFLVGAWHIYKHQFKSSADVT